MKRGVFLLFLLLILPSAGVSAQVKAVVDKTRVTGNGTVRFTVTVSGDKGLVDTGPIKDFNVHPRGTSTSIRVVNGKMDREVIYNYLLVPLRPGKLTIPSLTVMAGKKKYHTGKITVDVLQDTGAAVENKDVFVKALISNKTPYEGQQIIFTFSLYNAVRVVNEKIRVSPDFKGFTAKQIENVKPYNTVISGREYFVRELKYILIPLSPGKTIIKPIVLDCGIVRSGRKRGKSTFNSLFNDPFFGNMDIEPRTYRTSPIEIRIKPLPAFTGETTFSGLVGNFDISADIEGRELKTGDSITLTVVVKGEGNIMDAGDPSMKLPEAFKVYTDHPEESIQTGKKGFSGKKIFRYALVGVKEGDWSTGEIRLNYFDVSKSKYIIKSVKPFLIRVAKSGDRNDTAGSWGNRTDESPGSGQGFRPEQGFRGEQELRLKKQKVQITGRDILTIKEDLVVLENREPMSFFLFIVFLGIPVIICVMFRAAFFFTRKTKSAETLMAERSMRALKEAAILEEPRSEFFSLLSRSIVSAIYSKAGVRGESLTYLEAEKILRSKGFPGDTAKHAAALLRKIDTVRYGGPDMEPFSGKAILDETKQLVRGLVK